MQKKCKLKKQGPRNRWHQERTLKEKITKENKSKGQTIDEIQYINLKKKRMLQEDSLTNIVHHDNNVK